MTAKNNGENVATDWPDSLREIRNAETPATPAPGWRRKLLYTLSLACVFWLGVYLIAQYIG